VVRMIDVVTKTFDQHSLNLNDNTIEIEIFIFHAFTLSYWIGQNVTAKGFVFKSILYHVKSRYHVRIPDSSYYSFQRFYRYSYFPVILTRGIDF
jgi:hypothetical protein